jgi:hypothetical protein
VTPTPWEFLLLTLAAYRVWRLIAVDDIAEPIRAKIKPDGWWAALVECPWCAGAWISLAWVAAWWAWEDTVVVAVPFAVSAAVGTAAVVVDRLTE